jgi:transposase
MAKVELRAPNKTLFWGIMGTWHNQPLVPDALWARMAPLFPPEPSKAKGGRPRVPDRAALTGILCVLKSGILWEMLLQEMGCGSGMTCWRRLHDWHHAGAWHQLYTLLLAKLHAADKIDWTRAVVDSRSLRAECPESIAIGVRRNTAC